MTSYKIIIKVAKPHSIHPLSDRFIQKCVDKANTNIFRLAHSFDRVYPTNFHNPFKRDMVKPDLAWARKIFPWENFECHRAKPKDRKIYLGNFWSYSTCNINKISLNSLIYLFFFFFGRKKYKMDGPNDCYM